VISLPPTLLRRAAAPLLLALLVACGHAVPQAMAVEPGDDTACVLDGMLLKDFAGPKAQIHYAEGKPDFYCDLLELFTALRAPEQKRTVAAVYVQDMAKTDWEHPLGHWIEARSALYVVGSRKHGSMGPTFGSFASQPEADAFAAREGARSCASIKSTPTSPAWMAVWCTTRRWRIDAMDMDMDMNIDMEATSTRLEIPPAEPADMDGEALRTLFARTNYLLRESRKALLARHGVADEDALLEQIRRGLVAPEPAYAHYLSARILEQMRLQIRAELGAQLRGGEEPAPISVHLRLKQALEDPQLPYAARLAEAPRLAHDALLLSFDSGLMMEVRYAGEREYALAWSWGDFELRIDTAPLQGWPGHQLHGADGVILADPVTTPGSDCWLNFSGLLDLLLSDPLLSGRVAVAGMP